jgi:hypothetical protein
MQRSSESVNESFDLGPWIALLLGLALAFFGRALVLLQLGLLGALLGLLGANGLYTLLVAPSLGASLGSSAELVRLLALLGGAVVGWGLASLLRRLGVFVLGAIVGGGALSVLVQQAGVPAELAWWGGALVGGVLGLLLESPLLTVGTALLGGLVVASAASVLLAAPSGALPLLIGLGVAVLGAGAQLARP